MSTIHEVHKARILIQLNNPKIVKRLVNVQTIYKKGQFFEYKITLDGFPKKANYKFIKDGVIDSVEGVKRPGKSYSISGWIEISYHKNGIVFYKNIGGIGNIRPAIRFPSIEKINKPIFFFRIVGFTFDKLALMNKCLRNEDRVEKLEHFSTSSSIACDFYLSKAIREDGKRYQLTTKAKSMLKNFQTFQFQDEKKNIALHLNFYSSKEKDVHFIIPPRDLVKRIEGLFYYYWFRFLKIF